MVRLSATPENTMTQEQRKQSALMGALVADAASLGAHWIYDIDRLRDLRARHGGLAFLPVDPQNYAGHQIGYFAHGARRSGQGTQYGVALALTLRSLRARGGFDLAAHQQAFAAYFGAGGGYVGYVDRPTRGTLANLAAGQTAPSGIDDDQLPALASVPAVVAAHLGSADCATRVATAISLTNVNPVAQRQGGLFAETLAAVISGTPLAAALRQAAAQDAALQGALDSGEASSVAYGAVTGRACHLPMAMPLAWHILSRADSFEDAVTRNIDAGGDSAGRAIVIGALMGAERGLAVTGGIPLAWVLRLSDAAALWDDIQAVSSI